MNIEPIARIHNGHRDKFGIPRQSGIAEEDVSYVVFEQRYRVPEAFRRIEEFSHLWLLWHFTDTGAVRDFSPTVRPPRLGGNSRVGVFATRSPNRPNSIGMSSVRLDRVIVTERYGIVLRVLGADIMSGTEIIDVKPYIPYTDSHPDAVGSYADTCSGYYLEVDIPHDIELQIDERDVGTLTRLLSSDPRPSYHSDPERVYTMDYYRYKVSFRVEDTTLRVVGIELSERGEDEVYEYLRMR